MNKPNEILICTICTSTNCRKLFEVKGRYYNGPGKLPGTICKCNDCGNIFKHYTASVELLYDGRYVDCSESGFQKDYNDYEFLLNELSKQNNRSILDIGIGNGMALEVVRNGGYAIEGVEINDTLSERAVQKGFTIYNINIEKEQPDGKYDVLLLLDIVEHLEHPAIVIENLKRCLNNEGNMIIYTPNHGSLVVRIAILLKVLLRIDMPVDQIFSCSHITFFNTSTLEMLLKRLKLEIVSKKVTPYDVKSPGMNVNIIYLWMIALLDHIGSKLGYGGFRMQYNVKRINSVHTHKIAQADQ